MRQNAHCVVMGYVDVEVYDKSYCNIDLSQLLSEFVLYFCLVIRISVNVSHYKKTAVENVENIPMKNHNPL